MHTYLIKNAGDFPLVLVVNGIDIWLQPDEFYKYSGPGEIERSPVIRQLVQVGDVDYWEVGVEHSQNKVSWLKEGF